MLSLEKFKEIKSRMTNEGLKGDQHELDHDKDGKIERSDFAKLRAKKMKKEEAEQIDELSKETLGSYKHKAELSIPKDDRAYANRSKGIDKAEKKMKKEAAQYPRAAHTDVKDVAANRAPAEQQHAALHKVTVKNGIPDKHEDGSDKVKGAAKAQPAPKKNYVEDPAINKDIYIQSFKSYVQMKGDLERM
jgi:hypothetical protein